MVILFALFLSCSAFVFPSLFWWAAPLRFVAALSHRKSIGLWPIIGEMLVTLFLLAPLVWWSYAIKQGSFWVWMYLVLACIITAIAYVPFLLCVRFYKKYTSWYSALGCAFLYVLGQFILYRSAVLIDSCFVYPFAYTLLPYLEYPELAWPVYYLGRWVFACMYYAFLAGLIYKQKTLRDWISLHLLYVVIGCVLTDYSNIKNYGPFLSCRVSQKSHFSDVCIQVSQIFCDRTCFEKVFLMPEGSIEFPLTAKHMHCLETLSLGSERIMVLFGGYFRDESQKIYNCIYQLVEGECRVVCKKSHRIPFVENHASCRKSRQTTVRCFDQLYSVYICSELLCQNFVPCGERGVLCFASDQWTDYWYLKHYGLLMFLQAQLQVFEHRLPLVYCSPFRGVTKSWV